MNGCMSHDNVTASMRYTVLVLASEGRSQRQIAATIGRSRKFVWDVIQKKHSHVNPLFRIIAPGTPSKTTPIEERHIIRMFRKDPTCTTLHVARNASVSRWTIARRLKQAGITNHKAAKKLRVTKANRSFFL